LQATIPLQVQEIYEFSTFRLDLVEHTLLRGDQVVALTPKAFETLALLVQNSGHLVRKDELIERVWQDTVVEEGNLNVVIHTLRKALGDDPRESKYIETIAKRGYRFVAEVRNAGEHEGKQSEATTAAPLSTDSQFPYSTQITASRSPSLSLASSRRPRYRRRWAIWGAAVAAVALASAFFFVWRSNRRPEATQAAAPATVRSIAVLPFKVLSTEKGDEYLSLGLADALITSLSQTRQVIVRQTEAVAKYQNTGKDPLEAGREQGVDAVLEGQVQRIGDRVRVTARLVRTSDGASLWADHFDEQFTNIFAVEDAIGEKVARTTIRAMKGVGGDATTERLTKRYTENNEAYEAYLKGRYLWNKRTSDSLQKSLGYFENAIRLDPNYALAYVGLADTYTLLSFFTLAAPNDAFPKARAAAEKALAIDSTLAEAYSALGQVKSSYEWDWAGAEEQFQKGIALNPNYPLLHHWRSLNLMAMGRLEEARTAMQRALELDPLLLITNVNLGRIDYYEGQYEQAVKQYQRALELDQNFMRTHLRLGMAYAQQHRYQEALTEYYKTREISGNTPQVDAHIAHVLAISGKKSEARAALAALQKHATRQYVPPYDIALIYSGLGETDQAFKWLEKAYADHSTEMIYFKVDPMLESLRSDPRYQVLLRRMGLAQ
jgi:DNA-binding winged helix-turn-helix (wHTH) protein/TolB-like protein/Flp pilus assembly protein TadD